MVKLENTRVLRQYMFLGKYKNMCHGGGDLISQLCLIFVTPWTVACQAPLAMRSSKQEYWNGLPVPSPGDLPDPGIEPKFPMAPAFAGGLFTTSATWK